MINPWRVEVVIFIIVFFQDIVTIGFLYLVLSLELLVEEKFGFEG